MPNRKFEVTFGPTRDAEDTTPLSVVLSGVHTKNEAQARYNHLAGVPVHPPAEITDGAAPDAYLQLWELDRFKVDRYLTDEEGDIGPLDNRLVATFPGRVEMYAPDKFRFRPTQDPVFVRRTVEPLNGFVTLQLRPAKDSAEIQYTVPLPEYEGVLELAACIRPADTDRNYATETELSPRQVRNVQAALRRQIDEWGGFAVGFVTDFTRAVTQKDRDDAKARAEKKGKKDTAYHPVVFPGQRSETWDNNNAEFPRQAEDMIDASPTFIYTDGRVKMGFYITVNFRDWPALIDELRTQVANLLVIPLTKPNGDDNRPKISALEIFCHGGRTSVETTEGWGDASLRTKNAGDFVDLLTDHLSDHVVVPLFACNAARSPYSINGSGGAGKSDPTFAQRFIGDELGADCLSWVLQRKLQKAGHKHATVYGHTLAAHTTRNPYLAVYSPYGSADAASLFRAANRLTNDGRQAYFNRFAHGTNGISDTLYRERLHNANLLRVLSIQNAIYYPWAWNGGVDAGPSTPGFNAKARVRARAIFDELAGNIGSVAIQQDDFTFSADRKFITGLRTGGPANPQVSHHLKWTDYAAHMSASPLCIKLARMVQLLRHRCNKGIAIDGLLESGQGAWLKASPHSAKNATAIETSMGNMFDDGLFTFAIRSGDRFQVSVSGVGYDTKGEYITSRHPDVPNPLLAPNLPWSAFQGLINPFRLHRNLPFVMSRCMEHVKTSLTPRAIEDIGDTLVINGAGKGPAIVAHAQVHVALDTIKRAVFNATNGSVTLSMI